MGKPVSSFQQKVEWMVKHQDYWRGWPGHAPYSDDWIKRQMVRDGLISPNSNNYDIMDFGKLVAAARERIKR
ncbi:MAG: hypothetical protein KGL39_35355 [Patescibacteria group bacterium]|nr:hypothetical protein [Patescibacteria group bacterium]